MHFCIKTKTCIITKVGDIHAVFLSDVTPSYIPWRNKCIDICTIVFKVSLFINEKENFKQTKVHQQ